jgi:hypothetical protein
VSWSPEFVLHMLNNGFQFPKSLLMSENALKIKGKHLEEKIKNLLISTSGPIFQAF